MFISPICSRSPMTSKSRKNPVFMLVSGLSKPNEFTSLHQTTPIGAKNGAETKKSHNFKFNTAPEKYSFSGASFISHSFRATSQTGQIISSRNERKQNFLLQTALNSYIGAYTILSLNRSKTQKSLIPRVLRIYICIYEMG